jgi:hypothetical protein
LFSTHARLAATLAFCCLIPASRIAHAQAPIERPLFVYLIEGAPLEKNADAHIKKAVEIWSTVGIVFKPKIERITGDKVKQLLGDDRKLQSYFGDSDRESEPGWTERKALFKLRSDPKSMAVFFVNNTGSSRAEPEYFQAYVGSEPSTTPVGRTMAHEIGHLLLGPGHTGTKGVPWKSGLMENSGSVNDSISIHDADAAIARKRAEQIPK